MPMPASVRDAVVARVQRLGGASHRVLEAASLASDPFAPALLAPACALSELDVVLAIERAVQAHLLQEHEQGGFAFAHDLIRQAIDAALTEDRRRLVHRRLALGAEATSAHAAVIAGHHEASGEARRAVAWRLAAGDEALQLHALPQAIDQWRKGLADDPSPIEAVALHRRLVRACELADERDAARAHAAALCTLADQEGMDASVAAEARIAAAASKTHNDDAPGALVLLDRLPATLDDRLAGQAAVVRVDTLRELGRIDDSADAARSALKAPGLPDADRVELLGSLDAGRASGGASRGRPGACRGCDGTERATGGPHRRRARALPARRDADGCRQT